MNDNYIYIIFSATPSRIGRTIRFVVREPYNHVSISLDEEMENMFGFARRHYNTPFWGGFVRESLSRYHIGTESADVCICKLPVTAQQFKQTEALLNQMQISSNKYIYNYISAISSLIHKRVQVKDAYTCVEFCVHILKNLGFEVTEKEYYTVCGLQKQLSPYIHYTGKMPLPVKPDTDYLSRQPAVMGMIVSCRDILRLIPRLFHK